MTATTTTSAETTADAFAERILGSALGAIEVFSVFMGDRLGWYRSLTEDGPATPGDLAKRTGTNERYAREWLPPQGAWGVPVTPPPQPAPAGRHAAPPA